MPSKITTQRHVDTDPTFIIKVGDVYYVTAAVLTYDPNADDATEENRRFIEEQLVPYYEHLVAEQTGGHWRLSAAAATEDGGGERSPAVPSQAAHAVQAQAVNAKLLTFHDQITNHSRQITDDD